MINRLVTVFGGGGFVGRYVAQALIRRGARVRIAQRDPRAAFFLKPQGALGQTQFVAADIRRPETVRRALAGADVAVNLVGTLAGDFWGLHVEGAGHVAEGAREAGVRTLVHLSAIGADPASPSRYGATKGEGEARVRAARPDAVILRPSILFGREDQFVNRFAGLIRMMPVVPVIRPDARFQPLSVVDLAQAVATVIDDAPQHDGCTFELGGPQVMTMMEINRWIAAATGRDPAFMPLPDAVSGLIARLGVLPGGPITRDQWTMLGIPNVVSGTLPGIEALGIAPTPMEAVATDWLVQYRRNGRFADKSAI